ncbi:MULTISPECIES: MutS-related protein [unclassified Flavobacterium]|uniref:MutS-related protein n=1 Tax=unclassified Flavobacterium TaxID=196869 RepID=UPI00131B8DF4|nr:MULTISPECIES: DNA mismatch repair protein [unclassified Flavobacterium]
MEIYKSRVAQFSQVASTLTKKYNSISISRLLAMVLFFVSIYYYLKTNALLYSLAAVFFLVLFIILMRLHTSINTKRKINKALIDINTNEISYLEGKAIPFENGIEFNDFHHPYAYDLDIFGAHSLFQNLNRTATYIGKKTFAKRLLSIAPNTEIEQNQEAVKELSSKIEWRQEFLAVAKVGEDTATSYENLVRWTTFNSSPLSRMTVLISYLSPLLFITFLILYAVTSKLIFASILGYVFIFNLMVLGRFVKRILAEVATSTNIDITIHQYSLLLEKIEKEPFTSQKLIQLQQQLKIENGNASAHLKKLSELFSNMDSIGNFVTATVFNGTFLFNLHVFKALLKWKNNNGAALEQWLNVIGEMEMLNSLANFGYNNPDFVYPSLNTNYKIDFKRLSHPLLNKKTRIGNDVCFYPQSFMILTGSNMSGKSTFLRSLGINMVLAGIGSPVCALQANIHPLPVLVSMRLSDSLADSESYFFAEIKRLKQIMDELHHTPAFILLDEILRGTNSDDKRNGTIEVVKKVIAKNAIGAIATHDIEVCLTTNEYPETLVNKCFEVEIVNDELHFDYKLRDGICKNKSATFLMKKMGVI